MMKSASIIKPTLSSSSSHRSRLLISLIMIITIVIITSSTVVVLVVSSSTSSSLPAAPYLFWKVLGFTSGTTSLHPLTSSSRIAAVGGTDHVELFSTEDFMNLYASSVVTFDKVIAPKIGWPLPCRMCGGNVFAQVLHGRFLIVLPRGAGNSHNSNCTKDLAIKDEVFCLDTESTPTDIESWRDGWTSIGTLPNGMLSSTADDENNIVSFVSYQDATNIDSSKVANNKLFFVSKNGAVNLTNDEYLFSNDVENNLCKSKAWKWSNNNNNNNNQIIPTCTNVSAATMTTVGTNGINMAQTSSNSFYASITPTTKDALGMVSVKVFSSSSSGEGENSACLYVSDPFTNSAPAHSITAISQPYLVAMDGDSSAGTWNAKIYTESAPGATAFSSRFEINSNYPPKQFEIPFVSSLFPGFLLLSGSAVDAFTCGSGTTASVYGVFFDGPQFPKASSVQYDQEGLKRWKRLHNKALGKDDLVLQATFDVNGTNSFPSMSSSPSTPFIPSYKFDMWLSGNSSCNTVESVNITSVDFNAEKAKSPSSSSVTVDLTLSDVVNPPAFPVTCASVGVCPFASAPSSGTPACAGGTNSTACFVLGCCYNSKTGQCTEPNRGLAGQRVVFGSRSSSSSSLSSSSNYFKYSAGSHPVHGTQSLYLPELVSNFSITPSASHSFELPPTHTLSRTPTKTKVPTRTITRPKTRTVSQSIRQVDHPFKKSQAIIYACVAGGVIVLLATCIFCIVKRREMKRWMRKKGIYRSGDGDDDDYEDTLVPSDKERGGVNDNGSDDDDDGYGTIGKEDHTVEAVVQIEGADFAILKVAGRGAFGTVFQGKRLSDGALVAIKQVPLFTRNEVEDATKELETLLSVPYHKNILQCLVAGIRHGDAGSAGELPAVDRYAKVRGHPGAHHGAPLASMVLVTPFYKNGDLRGFVNSFKRAGRPVPPLACLSFAAQLCDVLDFLHKNSVVHRDIKPENLLLSDDYKQIVLTDFGLAKLQMFENETLMTKAGSLPYVAPECFHGSYHSSVDNWSVGSLMFAIVTKRVDSDNACVMYLEAQKPDFEQMIRRELSIMPKGYVDVVLGLLRDRPEQRTGLKEARKQLAHTIRDMQQNFSSQSLESAERFSRSRNSSEIV